MTGGSQLEAAQRSNSRCHTHTGKACSQSYTDAVLTTRHNFISKHNGLGVGSVLEFSLKQLLKAHLLLREGSRRFLMIKINPYTQKGLEPLG